MDGPTLTNRGNPSTYFEIVHLFSLYFCCHSILINKFFKNCYYGYKKTTVIQLFNFKCVSTVFYISVNELNSKFHWHQLPDAILYSMNQTIQSKIFKNWSNLHTKRTQEKEELWTKLNHSQVYAKTAKLYKRRPP